MGPGDRRAEDKMSFEQLRLEAVSRHFANPAGGRVAALNDLSVSVPRGEFVALLGPSGCGKTTALNCIAGLLPLTSGSIWLDAQRIDVLPSEKRGFGMVFQNYALFPHMTVRRNVGFGLRMRRVGAAEAERRVTRALELVQLSGHEDKLPGQLSGGQQQRVALARAIVIEPPLVLMDEPLSNLDAKLRLEMRAEIRRIHRELGRATIYVTHDQDEALSLADRIIVMKDGVVQQIAAPQEIYAQPANLHVARFMGYRNVLELEVRQVNGNAVVLGGNGLRLEGVAKQPLQRRAMAAIRPEDFVVEKSTVNLIDGRIEAVEYCGRDSLLDVRTASGVLLHARMSASAALGEAVRISVPPERVLVYPAEAA
jgi:putative spermidine/putrescine transport system ATP-binding protein